MKALSIYPEPVMEIFMGDKTIEYRTWQTDYRGDLLICAGSKKEPGFVLIRNRTFKSPIASVEICFTFCYNRHVLLTGLRSGTVQGDAPKPIPFYTVMTVDTAMASHASPAVFRQFGPVKTAGRRKDQAENIHEKVLCIGAKDDVLWDTFRFSGIHAEDHAFGGR